MEKAQNLPTELMAHVLRMTQYSKYFFFKKKSCTSCVVVLDGTLPFIHIYVLVSVVTFVFVMWTVFCADIVVLQK